jgi:hypothetical protein
MTWAGKGSGRTTRIRRITVESWIRLSDILAACVLISLLVMIPFSVTAWIRLNRP